VFERCRTGDEAHRLGVATILAQELPAGRGGEAAATFLSNMFNDESQKVQEMAASVFRDEKVLRRPEATLLLNAFVTSQAVDVGVQDLFFGLDRFDGPIRHFAGPLRALIDLMTKPSGPEAEAHRAYGTGTLARILLRLYEQADHDRDLRRQCLDSWDLLLQRGAFIDVLQQIDR
jgi:hypothetical protein